MAKGKGSGGKRPRARGIERLGGGGRLRRERQGG